MGAFVVVIVVVIVVFVVGNDGGDDRSGDGGGGGGYNRVDRGDKVEICFENNESLLVMFFYKRPNFAVF